MICSTTLSYLRGSKTRPGGRSSSSDKAKKKKTKFVSSRPCAFPFALKICALFFFLY